MIERLHISGGQTSGDHPMAAHTEFSNWTAPVTWVAPWVADDSSGVEHEGAGAAARDADHHGLVGRLLLSGQDLVAVINFTR